MQGKGALVMGGRKRINADPAVRGTRLFLFIFLFSLSSFIFQLHFAFAQAIPYTEVPQTPFSTIPDGIILTKDKNPWYAPAGLHLERGTTMMVKEGVVLKFGPGARFKPQFLVYGNLIVEGTASEPVVFTSWHDDADGTDLDGPILNATIPPQGGDWKRMQMGTGPFPDCRSELHYLTIRYAEAAIDLLQYNPDDCAIITDHLAFESNAIGITTNLPVDLRHSSFTGNGTALFYWFSSTPLDVRDSWWGDVSGPYHPILNPGGLGQIVSGPSPMLFDPWVGKFQPHPPVLSMTQEEGLDIDGVRPDKGTADLTPFIFKVTYTDEDNDPPQSIAVNINANTFPLEPDRADTVTVLLKDGDFTNGEQYFYASTFPKGSYQFHFEASDSSSTARLPATGELSFSVDNQPVILIPGIAGSELFHEGKEVWMDVGKMASDFGDEFLEVLAMDAQGQSIENIEVGDIVRQKFPIIIWSRIIEELENSGYTEGQNLFVFPYDWRKDNRETAGRLHGFIETILQQTSSPKVDLVAHSMGGLVAKQYITQHGEQAIDQLVFIGTPHHGAPKALKVLLYGDQFSIPVLDTQALKGISRNMSSVYQLLPSQSYVDGQETYFIDRADIDEDGVTGRLNFTQTQELIRNIGLNAGLQDDAHVFHASLDGWSASPALLARTHNIIGCGIGTPDTFVSFQDKGKKAVLLITAGGDETVPLKSARKVGADGAYYIPKAKHARMPDHSLIRHLVVDILQDNIVNVLEEEYEDIQAGAGNCTYTATAHRVHSPVDLHAYDALGNHTGPNSLGGIDEEIPGSSYYALGEDKQLFLPKGLDANVLFEGTGIGTFRYDITEADQGGEQESVRFFNLPVTPQTKGEVVFDENNIAGALVKLDQEGDGQFEQTYSPSSFLDPQGAGDFIPPLVNIGNPVPNAAFEHHQVLSIEGSIIDETVPLTVVVSIDGKALNEQTVPSSPFTPSYPLPLPTLSLGEHSITVNVHDAAGNYTATTTVFTVIATPASMAGLIDWGTEHGWYRNPYTHKLIRNLAGKILPFTANLPPKAKRAKLAIIDALITLLDKLHKQGMIIKVTQDMLTGDLIYIRGQL